MYTAVSLMLFPNAVEGVATDSLKCFYFLFFADKKILSYTLQVGVVLEERRNSSSSK
jgi:hypothetical protein